MILFCSSIFSSPGEKKDFFKLFDFGTMQTIIFQRKNPLCKHSLQIIHRFQSIWRHFSIHVFRFDIYYSERRIGTKKSRIDNVKYANWLLCIIERNDKYLHGFIYWQWYLNVIKASSRFYQPYLLQRMEIKIRYHWNALNR